MSSMLTPRTGPLPLATAQSIGNASRRAPVFAILAVGILAAATGALAASTTITALLERRILDARLPLIEVQDYAEARVPLIPKINSMAEWEKTAEQLRKDVLEKIVFRGHEARQWRDAKTKVEWLETISGGPAYRIKKLRYEALPGMWIPALLYEPETPQAKIPVHLAVNGHGAEGKAIGQKQIRCINLAKRGIASLNVEWFNMGQLRSDGFAHYRMNQLDLCGVSGLAPFYLNMSRALDILLTLPYADPKRVAVSGLSGGGWQTIVISALDPRVTLCNPVAGYSSFRTRARFPSDLGDSEQTPNDLATVADYTHLTAMLAGRAALLTYNIKDDCCFASDHALPPLHEAAAPIFKLFEQGNRLRTHVNHEPGTHNFELDNRQAFYRVIGEEFFPQDATYSAKEVPSDSEVKSALQLNVPLPETLDFNELAKQLAKGLPHDPELAVREPAAARKKLAEIVKFQKFDVAAQKAGSETSGDTNATFWKLRMGSHWTVPAVELERGGSKGTVLLVSDGGRKAMAAEVEALLANGQRVVAIDPFYFGESKIAEKDFLHALLVAAVGDRPLGIQASQVAAAASWARGQFGNQPVSLHGIGPRSCTFALIAGALEQTAIARINLADPLNTLHEVIDKNWAVNEKPELFCFGLLESFDIPQVKQLAGEGRLE